MQLQERCDILALCEQYSNDCDEIRDHHSQCDFRDHLIDLRDQNSEIEDQQRHFCESRRADIENHANPRNLASHNENGWIANIQIPNMSLPAIFLDGDNDEGCEYYGGELVMFC